MIGRRKKLKFAILILCTTFPLFLFAQSHNKEPEYNYLSHGTNVYTNATGSLTEKALVTIEFDRSSGKFDLELMLGMLTLDRNVSSYTLESLPTINVFSKGKFSEALTLGAGYIINTKNNFLTELTNSINYAPSTSFILK